MVELAAGGRRETPSRVQRGEQQRVALRALVMGDRPAAPSCDPAGLGAMAGWWSARSWLPPDAYGALAQIVRSCAVLSERSDRALEFEASRMALSVGIVLTDALAAPCADLVAPFASPRQQVVNPCPRCGALVAAESVAGEEVRWLEQRCDTCGTTMSVVQAARSALPKIQVAPGHGGVFVDGDGLTTRRWEHEGRTLEAVVHGETLRPIMIGSLG